MSMSVRKPSVDRGIELDSVVNWPAVAVSIGWGLLVLGVPLALTLFALLRPAPEDETPAHQWQALAWHLPAPSAPRPPRAPAPDVVTTATPPTPAVPEVQPKRSPTTTPSAPVRTSGPLVAQRPAPTPAPAPTPKAEPVKEVKQVVASFRRMHGYQESQLLYLLEQHTREIDVEKDKDTTKHLLRDTWEVHSARKPDDKAEDKDQPLFKLIARRPDLGGLPLRMGADCLCETREARAIGSLSREVRGQAAREARRQRLGKPRPGSEVQAVETSAMLSTLESIDKTKAIREFEKEKEVALVRILVQMFQADTVAVRLRLVKQLSGYKSEAASAAVARLAMFDLAADVREAAVKVLKDRPLKEYRPVLLKGLRYPWAPVAQHAAQALVVVNAQEAVGDLVALLDQPDPCAPFKNKEDKWVVAEVVRINHMKNCVLCHAPSYDGKDSIRGFIPERGKQLPEVYYSEAKGDFVRADVTYLRQDFSVTLAVTDVKPWPAAQRFDYLVRQRELTETEVVPLFKEKEPDRPSSYPQRAAVLWALRQLTGDDAGDRSDDWRALVKKRRAKGE